MDTLTIDRATPTDTLTVDREPTPNIALDDIDTTTPSTQEEVDALYDAINPDRIYINPDDYEDETDYICAIPGMEDYLRASMRLPKSAFEKVVRARRNGTVKPPKAPKNFDPPLPRRVTAGLFQKVCKHTTRC